MQYAYMAACTKGVERGAEVPFSFRPLMTTVTVDIRFSEAAEVQKLVLSSENDPVAGAFTFDIEHIGPPSLRTDAPKCLRCTC